MLCAEFEGMLDIRGYKRTIFKSDQEPAIIELKRDVARIKAEVEFIPEESPVEDSRSNGYIERSIQTVQGQIRASKEALGGQAEEAY